MADLKRRIVLILVDGLRPDAISECAHPFLRQLMGQSTCANARTVMPSVTLPCHTSLFYSSDSERHGILTNDWRPMVRPIESLLELAHRFDYTTAMLYNWEQLRDMAKPGTLDFSYMRRLTDDDNASMACDRELAEACVDNLGKNSPGLTFLYLGCTDEAGHRNGWMGEEYLEAVSNASACIERVYNSLDENDIMIVTADHGGHGRMHGDDTDECMNIPLILNGKPFTPGAVIAHASIKDIAPTIAGIMSIKAPAAWEGKNLLA